MKRIYETEFHAAQIIVGHSKCGILHGHSYGLRVEVDFPEEVWWDFGDLKQLVGSVVADYDHQVLGCEYYEATRLSEHREEIHLTIHTVTAEMLAREIEEKITRRIPPHLYPGAARALVDVKVELFETSKFGVKT